MVWVRGAKPGNGKPQAQRSQLPDMREAAFRSEAHRQ